MAASSPIEFWFDFSSPYGYFAAHEIDRRMADLGRRVVWRPLLLGAVFKLTGMAALNTMPMRGDYAKHDWARIARMLAIPFRLPDRHPFASQTVARAFYWLDEHAPAQAKPFAQAAFEEHFVHDRAPETIDPAVSPAGRFIADTAALAAWLPSEAAKQALRTRTEEAVSKGVFGSPYVIADGEPFWGWDRMPMLEDWLRRGRW